MNQLFPPELQELLYDDSPMVRSLTVLGVGRALCRYWELVPLSVVKSLLHKMIRELAYDSGSDNVRVAVIQVGVCSTAGIFLNAKQFT